MFKPPIKSTTPITGKMSSMTDFLKPSFSNDDVDNILKIRVIKDKYLEIKEMCCNSLYAYVVANFNGDIGRCTPSIATLIYLLTITNSIYFTPNDFSEGNGLTENEKRIILSYKTKIIEKLMGIFTDYRLAATNLLTKLTSITSKKRAVQKKPALQKMINELTDQLQMQDRYFRLIIESLNACNNSEKDFYYDKKYENVMLLDKGLRDNIVPMSRERKAKDEGNKEPDDNMIDRYLQALMGYCPKKIQTMNNEIESFPNLTEKNDIKTFERYKEYYYGDLGGIGDKYSSYPYGTTGPSVFSPGMGGFRKNINKKNKSSKKTKKTKKTNLSKKHRLRKTNKRR